MNEAWIGAGASVVGGIVVGALLASATRRVLRALDAAPSCGSWPVPPRGSCSGWQSPPGSVAVTTVEPQTIEDVPADLLAYLPRVFAAGLILLAGRAVAVVCAGATGRAVARALGRPSGPVAAVVRLGVNLAGVVLALSQLGVDTTVLVVLVAGLSASFGLAFALLVGLGGRDVARQIAAGRYLRRVVSPGSTVRSSGVSESVVALHPLRIEVLTDDGRRVHVPHTPLLGDVLEVDGGQPADS